MRLTFSLALLLGWLYLATLPTGAAAPAPEAPRPTPLPRAARVEWRPVWKLPALLRDQGDLNLSARVEVEVYSDGTTSCRLLRTTGRPEVDHMLLDWLRQWQWAPATEDDQPVRSVERFDLDLVVE